MQTEKIKIYHVSFFIIFFISFLFCSCGNFKTNNNAMEYQLFQLYYENSSGEKGLTTFDYNDKGVLEKAIWELADGSRTSLNTYKHDEKGNLTNKYREFSDGLISNQYYEYDKNNNLIREIFERSDDTSGVATYEYDINGRLKNAVCDGLNGWFFGELNYIYDESGKKQKADITQEGENKGVIYYSYDEHGNLIEEKWEFSSGWSQTFFYVYRKYRKDNRAYYTSSNAFLNKNSGYRVIRENYDYSGKTGGPSYYRYDTNGKLVSKRFERSDNFYTQTTYLYDNQGKLTKSYRKYSNGLTAVFTYEFDNPQELTGRTFKRTDGKAGSEIYEYDGDSNLIKATWENVDSWLTGDIEFKHDVNGNICEGYFQGNKDLNAKIDFKHDKNGNLINIQWNFSTGDTQTYTYEYEMIQ